MTESKMFKSISMSDDLVSDWFLAEGKRLNSSGGVLFYINGVLTRGVCSVNERDKTYVAEFISLDDGVWYERRGFCELVVMTHGTDDHGNCTIGGGKEILRLKGDRMNS